MIKLIEEYFVLSKKLLTTGSIPEVIMVAFFGVTIPTILTIALANHIHIFYNFTAVMCDKSVISQFTSIIIAVILEMIAVVFIYLKIKRRSP